MRYDFNGKRINIPDEFIEKNMRNLSITRQEAVDLYLSDEGIITNDQVVAMTEKAKTAGVGIRNQGSTKRKAPVRKPDEVKRSIIAVLANFINQEEYGVSNVEVTNIERMIAFELGGEKFELTLTKKRKVKE